MTDLESETLKHFIRYVHLGYLDADGAECAEGLLVFADKYLIGKLKDECVSILKKGICKHNILDRLGFAFTHNIGELKDHLIEHLVDKSFDGNSKWMMRTDEWFAFAGRNTEVSREIMTAFFDKLPL